MDIVVTPEAPSDWRGTLEWNRVPVRCALGRGGVSEDKREGDGATPAGAWLLRRVYYRPDRVTTPETGLPTVAIATDLGWCNDPGDPAYNRLVRLPHAGRCERMRRQDHLYDVMVELAYNDSPVVPGRGSAIFLHLARPDFGPTEGCVAIAIESMVKILSECGVTTRLRILPDKNSAA